DFHVTGVQTCALPIWVEHRLEGIRPLEDAVRDETARHGAVRDAPCPEARRDMKMVGRRGGRADEGQAIDGEEILVRPAPAGHLRSEERRVGKEGRARW